MTAAPLNQTVRTVLLDIEGTTTPLNFVYNVLFPYVRSHAMQFLAKHRSSPEVLADIAALHQEYMVDLRGGLDPPTLGPDTQDAEIEPLVTYVEWLIERDRKSTGLKSLQGKIWEEGYKSHELRGEVFDDVPLALKRLKEQRISINIFSSGSVLAQTRDIGTLSAARCTPENALFAAPPPFRSKDHRRSFRRLVEVPLTVLGHLRRM